MNAEYIETSRGRVSVRLALCAALILCYVIVDSYWPRFMGFVKALPPCEQVPWWRTILIVVATPFFFVVALMIWDGYRALHFRQWPVPGAFVWWRTKIKRGAWVLVQATMSFVMAGVIVAGFAYLANLAWPVLRLVFVALPGCQAT